MTSIGTLTGTLKLDDQYSGGMLKGINATKTLAVAGGALAAATLAAGAAMAKAAGDALKMADALDNQAKATSFNVESLQVYNLAAQQAGASSSAITTSVQRLQKSIADGSKETTEAFARLGTSSEELKRIAPERQFETIMQRLGDIENPAVRASTAMTLLGRSGANLQALTGSTLPQLEERMRSLGLVVDGGAVAAMDRLEEKMSFMSEVSASLWTNFGAGIATSEGLSQVTDLLTEQMGALNVWVQSNRDQIASWVNTGILVAAGTIEFTLQFVGAFVAGLGLLGGVMPKLQLAFLNWFNTLLSSPIADFIPGVEGMRENLLSMSESVTEVIAKEVEFFEKNYGDRSSHLQFVHRRRGLQSESGGAS